MTHKDLVEAAYKWVLKNASCGVAFKELNSLASNGEHPDVIGFGSGGHSVLVECKISRSDFLADKKKPFRICPELGMGSYRFYCCPVGLLQKEDLPENWGLLWVSENLKTKCVYKPYKGYICYGKAFEKNLKAEHELMYSALRRLQIRGRIEEIYNKNF
jgi:hypothetical protein